MREVCIKRYLWRLACKCCANAVYVVGSTHYTCTRIHVCACKHKQMLLYTSTELYTHAQAHTFARTFAHTYACTQAQVLCSQVDAHTHTRVAQIRTYAHPKRCETRNSAAEADAIQRGLHECVCHPLPMCRFLLPACVNRPISMHMFSVCQRVHACTQKASALARKIWFIQYCPLSACTSVARS